jgi:hypothetical protein
MAGAGIEGAWQGQVLKGHGRAHLDVVEVKQSSIPLHEIVRPVPIENARAQVLPPAFIARLEHLPLLGALSQSRRVWQERQLWPGS